jgi:hypothetical protein
MGPMICDEEHAAGFMKVNLWSNWANGATGLMWWCANEQSHLNAPPYDWNMCERELGMLDKNRQPKPMLLVMKQFSEELAQLSLPLPYRTTDGICILSRGQDHWGIAYMTYILAKQAGLTLDFAYCEQELPDSALYFLPSVRTAAMSKKRYDLLKQKVYDGATLYISINNAFLTEFEDFTGLRVETAYATSVQGKVELAEAKIAYRKSYQFNLILKGAQAILSEESGNPLFTRADYGNGTVYFLNFPMEEMLLGEPDGVKEDCYIIYQKAADAILSRHQIGKSNPFVGCTLHQGEDRDYAVLVNYTAQVQKTGFTVRGEYRQADGLYGNAEILPPFGSAVVGLKKVL